MAGDFVVGLRNEDMRRVPLPGVLLLLRIDTDRRKGWIGIGVLFSGDVKELATALNIGLIFDTDRPKILLLLYPFPPGVTRAVEGDSLGVLSCNNENRLFLGVAVGVLVAKEGRRLALAGDAWKEDVLFDAAEEVILALFDFFPL